MIKLLHPKEKQARKLDQEEIVQIQTALQAAGNSAFKRHFLFSYLILEELLPSALLMAIVMRIWNGRTLLNESEATYIAARWRE